MPLLRAPHDPALRLPAPLRQMLLINSCRGFPGVPQQEQDAKPGKCGSGKGMSMSMVGRRVFLPSDILQRILELAASTPEARLPQLDEHLAAWRASQRGANGR